MQRNLVYPALLSFFVFIAMFSLSLFFLSSSAWPQRFGASPLLSVTDGLVSYWKFDETSGITAADSAGANPGTLVNGPLWTAGKIGGGLSFDGVNDYVNTADIPFDFERTNSFSAAVWVKIPSTTLENSILGKSTISPYTGWSFYVEPTSLRVFLVNTWTSNAISKDSAISVADNTWHHVAFTYNGNSDASGVNIYVDGNLSNGTVNYNSLTASILNNQTLLMGADVGGATSNFKGVIDDARIYNRVLTATEVQTLYATAPSFFDFFLPTPANVSVTQGSSVTNTITATLVSGTSQSVSFTTSGIPAGATYSYSPTSCTPTCTSTMTINSGTAVKGTYTITVTGTAGSLTHSTMFSLTVSPLVTITAYQHPGGYVSLAQIAHIKDLLNQKVSYVVNDYNRMISNANAALSHTPNPPTIYYEYTAWQDDALKLEPDAEAAFASALAWQFTRQQNYAAKAREIINAWSTVNTQGNNGNPHEGRGLAQYGSLLVASAELISDSPAFTTSEKDSMKQWIMKVLFHNVLQKDVSGAQNHATLAYKSLIAGAHFLDRRDLMQEGIQLVLRDIQWDIQPSGEQWHETQRGAQGMSYSWHNLGDLVESAIIIRNSEGLDLFNYVSRFGTSIRKAGDYMVYYFNNPSQWPWYKGSDLEVDPARWWSEFLGTIYNDSSYKNLPAASPATANRPAGLWIGYPTLLEQVPLSGETVPAPLADMTYPRPDIIVDNGAPGTSFTGTWIQDFGSKVNTGLWWGPNAVSTINSSGASYTWNIPLNTTGTHTIALWTPERDWLHPSTIEIYDGNQLVKSLTYINWFPLNNGRWVKLVTYSFSSATAKVVTYGDASNYVTADAVGAYVGDAAISEQVDPYSLIYNPSPSFDFSLSSSGNKSLTQGQSTTNTITATLISGSAQSVSFTNSVLPAGAITSYSPTSCTPTSTGCTSTLTIATLSSTPTGTYTITVTGTAGGLTHTSTFSLTVSASVVNITNVTFIPLLQGRGSMPTGTSLTLTFYTPGTTTLKATAIMASDASGKLTFPSSVTLAAGNYDFLTATNGYLKKKQLNVALASNTTLALAQLTAGDFNSDNVVNSLDWSAMNAQWFSNNAQSDVNGDGIVNSLDFSYLNSNWNKAGD